MHNHIRGLCEVDDSEALSATRSFATTINPPKF